MSKLYDLIPSQLNIYMLVKFSFHKQIVQIPSSFAVDADVDFDLLTRALNIEFSRNDATRLRFINKDGKIKQYFLDSFSLKCVPVLHFSTKEAQEEFFERDARKPVRFFKDEIFRLFFFVGYNGFKGIYFNCTHLAMDAIGIMIFFLDLLAVYRALEKGESMPKPLYRYEDYIQAELKRANDPSRLAKGEAFYKAYFAEGGEPFYAGVHGPALLEAERKKKGDPALRVTNAAYAPKNAKAEVLQLPIDRADAEAIFGYCKANDVAPETLFTLAMRTYCSALNFRTEDVFWNMMCAKRINYKDQQTCGCFAQTLQVRTRIPETATFKEALDEILRGRTQLFRHLSYPFIYARAMLMKMYGHSATQGVAAFMFSWLPIPIDRLSELKLEFKTYSPGYYFNPLYAICYPDPLTGGVMMHYMYRSRVVSEENVRALHENIVSLILRGIADPEIICEFVEVDPASITVDTNIRTDLGLNSLELVNLGVEIEEEFGVEIPDREAMNLATVADAIRIIEKYED